MVIHLIIGWLRWQQASHNSGRRRFEAEFQSRNVAERERGRERGGAIPPLAPIKNIQEMKKYKHFNQHMLHFWIASGCQ